MGYACVFPTGNHIVAKDQLKPKLNLKKSHPTAQREFIFRKKYNPKDTLQPDGECVFYKRMFKRPEKFHHMKTHRERNSKVSVTPKRKSCLLILKRLVADELSLLGRLYQAHVDRVMWRHVALQVSSFRALKGSNYFQPHPDEDIIQGNSLHHLKRPPIYSLGVPLIYQLESLKVF